MAERVERMKPIRNEARIFVVGLFLGGLSHHWYIYIDQAFPRAELDHALIKVSLDQIIAGPIHLTIYIFAIGLLEGSDLEFVYEEWKFKFVEIYKVDCVFWPGAQLVNFLLIPDRFRVFYVNVATFVWNIYLTYNKHRTRSEIYLVHTPPSIQADSTSH